MSKIKTAVFVRFGATIEITNVEGFKTNPEEYIKQSLIGNHISLDGELYIPDAQKDIPEELLGFEFDLNPIPITLGTAQRKLKNGDFYIDGDGYICFNNGNILWTLESNGWNAYLKGSDDVISNTGEHTYPTDNDLAEARDLAGAAFFYGEEDTTAENPKITISLNIFDEEGNQVDTTTTELPIAGISDILDHATQAILVRRGQEGPATLDEVLNELENALVVYNIIEKKD